MMNVFSSFSDEAATWTICGLIVEALSPPCFRWDLHQPRCAGWDSIFIWTLIVLCFHVYSWDSRISVSAQDDTVFLHSITCSVWLHKCQNTRLLGQWPEVLQYHCARKLGMKPAAFPLPSPLTTSRRCPGSRTCHSAVEDGNISLLVLVIKLSWCKAAVFWMLRGY